ncbi:MAG: hypothetical protein NTAFB01_33610 [Nitrospira sp.]
MLEVHVEQESDLESCMAQEAGSILPLNIQASAMFAGHYYIHCAAPWAILDVSFRALHGMTNKHPPISRLCERYLETSGLTLVGGINGNMPHNFLDDQTRSQV